MTAVITAPEPVGYEDMLTDPPALFLAGGITDCPDWQADAVAMLEGVDATILNPRRPDFDVSDPNASELQIEWEYGALRRADVILFWFPAETLCPIALYELGTWSALNTPLAVGTHPDYARRYDVVKQTGLIRPEILVVSNLRAVVAQAIAALERVRSGMGVQWLTPPI